MQAFPPLSLLLAISPAPLHGHANIPAHPHGPHHSGLCSIARWCWATCGSMASSKLCCGSGGQRQGRPCQQRRAWPWPPAQLAGAELLYFTASSFFKNLLSELVSAWICSTWATITKTQRFLLRNPSQTVPAIEAATSGDRAGLRAAASVLVAAELALNRRADSALRGLRPSTWWKMPGRLTWPLVRLLCVEVGAFRCRWLVV